MLHEDDITSLQCSCVDPLIAHLDQVFHLTIFTGKLIYSIHGTRMAIHFHAVTDISSTFKRHKNSKNGNGCLQMSLLVVPNRNHRQKSHEKEFPFLFCV